MKETIIVGISDQRTSQSPNILATYALGSCGGVSLYDETTGIGGLAHIMLPTSGPMQGVQTIERMKFADTAIEDLVNRMITAGANKRQITAKIAGGANMFKIADDTVFGNIGQRNVESVKQSLSNLSLPLVGEDTGEDFGRTIFFDLSTGKVTVQTLGKSVKEI
jgi:chemotaxis protein CheD